MTSDHLGEVPEARRRLFSGLAGEGATFTCDFPLLGQTALRHGVGTGPPGRPTMVSEGDPVLVQRVRRADRSVLINVFNTGDLAAERLIPWALTADANPRPVTEDGVAVAATAAGVHVALAPHQSRQLEFAAN